MTASDLDLIGEFIRDQSQDAFTALVQRHLGLVYCAALRQVGSSQLAEEVAQSVFIDLAQNAGRLKANTNLTAWLYKVTCRTAINVVRAETRRRAREQIASELKAMNATTAEWTHIEPLLDQAMHELADIDRAAVLLRYFENKSLREVGQMLGTTDDAAQKRISRAVERLRELFTRRGVTVSTSGLLLGISSNAAQGAPVGLAISISNAAALAGSTAAATAAATATKAIAMTTLQKALIIGVFATTVGIGIYEVRRAAGLHTQVQLLQQHEALLLDQIGKLTSDNLTASNNLAQAEKLSSVNTVRLRELLRLRGEVAALRRQQREFERPAPVAQSKAPGQSDVAGPPNTPAPFRVQLVLDAPGDNSEPMTNAAVGGETLHLEKTPLVDHTAVRSATVEKNSSSGAPEIHIEFNPEGNDLFAAVTRENINKRLAIVLAGRVYAAPIVRSEISAGKAQITGSFTEDEALELATKINEAIRGN
jgi:RNA polymerase sigma factor (sigma-70 family)